MKNKNFESAARKANKAKKKATTKKKKKVTKKSTKDGVEIVESSTSLVAIATENMLAVITHGIDKKVDPESMRALLDLQREIRKDAAIQAFNMAMQNFHATITPIKHDKRATIKAKQATSKDFTYTYASFAAVTEHVRPVADQFGFSWNFNTVRCFTPDGKVIDGAFDIVCTISHIDGHSKNSTFPTFTDERVGSINKMQRTAGASTFGKRQAFISGFGLSTTDTDIDGTAVKTSVGVVIDGETGEVDNLAPESKEKKSSGKPTIPAGKGEPLTQGNIGTIKAKLESAALTEKELFKHFGVKDYNGMTNLYLRPIFEWMNNPS